MLVLTGLESRFCLSSLWMIDEDIEDTFGGYDCGNCQILSIVNPIDENGFILQLPNPDFEICLLVTPLIWLWRQIHSSCIFFHCLGSRRSSKAQQYFTGKMDSCNINKDFKSIIRNMLQTLRPFSWEVSKRKFLWRICLANIVHVTEKGWSRNFLLHSKVKWIHFVLLLLRVAYTLKILLSWVGSSTWHNFTYLKCILHFQWYSFTNYANSRANK